METRVVAILVARNGVAYLERTLSGLSRQTRAPDSFIAVDAGSTDSSAELLAASGPAQFVTTSAQLGFGEAVGRALTVAGPAASPDEWLWLLAHDNAPRTDTLERLLAAVEIAPSVAVAGPKLMRWDEPDVIGEFGESMTVFGASFALVEGELDQAQHDLQSDVLAVAAGGMLVRRSLWTDLGGFDPGLPAIDAALDFSVRARLAGYRVVSVPRARVLSAGGPELFGRRSVSELRRLRLRRAAQLHRRLVYAPAVAVPFHWLSLVPLAILRSLGQLLAKRPGAVGGELRAAFATAFGRGGIGAARRNLARSKTLGWKAVSPLRMPGSIVRERRAQLREAERTGGEVTAYEARAGFVSHGGLFVVVLAALIGIVALSPLLGSQSLTGGTLAPLSDSVAQLWANVGYGWREIGVGFTGAADPFSYVLAVLGSVTFWAPSLSIVILFFLALPLAALGAWFAARRVSARLYLPSFAALLWAVGPPLLSSLSGGHLGSLIAQILLPWFALALLNAPRSWTSSAAAGLLFAAIVASAPILAPALVVGVVAWTGARPKSVFRLIGIPLPAIVLCVPIVVQQILRGNPLALLAEPGVPVANVPSSGLHLALLSSGPGLGGWTAVIQTFTSSPIAATVVVGVLLAPVAVLAILALCVPGSRRAVPALLVALVGFATAVAATHIQVASVGATPITLWPDAALGLFWLGLIASALVALDALHRASIPIGIIAAATVTLLAVPLLGVQFHGPVTVATGTRILPAVVTAEASGNLHVGTLVLASHSLGSLSATIERGSGPTLDDQSTLASTSRALSTSELRVATLSANLASRSGLDSTADLQSLSIGFILLRPDTSGSSAGSALYQRTIQAVNANPLFTQVGSTNDGILWRYSKLGSEKTPARLSNTGSPLGSGILLAQAIIFGGTLLLGIPTTRRRRRVRTAGILPGEPADTFDGDDDE